jgi:hypothetical protein
MNRLIDQQGEEIGIGRMSYSDPWLYVGSEEGIIRVNILPILDPKSFIAEPSA